MGRASVLTHCNVCIGPNAVRATIIPSSERNRSALWAPGSLREQPYRSELNEHSVEPAARTPAHNSTANDLSLTQRTGLRGQNEKKKATFYRLVCFKGMCDLQLGLVGPLPPHSVESKSHQNETNKNLNKDIEHSLCRLAECLAVPKRNSWLDGLFALLSRGQTRIDFGFPGFQSLRKDRHHSDDPRGVIFYHQLCNLKIFVFCVVNAHSSNLIHVIHVMSCSQNVKLRESCNAFQSNICPYIRKKTHPHTQSITPQIIQEINYTLRVVWNLKENP